MGSFFSASDTFKLLTNWPQKKKKKAIFKVNDPKTLFARIFTLPREKGLLQSQIEGVLIQKLFIYG